MKMLRFLVIFCFFEIFYAQHVPLGIENDDEVIFEKAADPEPWTEERETVMKEDSPVCMEAQLSQKDGGGQCLDLLAALHNLLIDDHPGINKAIDAPMVHDVLARLRRNADDQGTGIGQLESIGKNDTNSSLGELSDVPIVDEEPIFVENVPKSENSSLPVEIPLTFLALNESHEMNGTIAEYAIPAETRNLLHEFENKLSIQVENNSTVAPVRVNEKLIWEISTVLAQLSVAAENASVDGHHVDEEDLATIGRIEALLSKLLPILVQMKATIRKGSMEGVNATLAGMVNSSKGFDTTEPPNHPLPPFFLVSINATGPSILDNHTDAQEIDPTVSPTPPHFFPFPQPLEVVLIPSIPSESPESPGTEPKFTAAATAPPESAPASTSTVRHPVTHRPIDHAIENHPLFKPIDQKLPTEEKLVIFSNNISNEMSWREKLLERAPYFLPKEQATWWKAEKRRQQACVLLSSIDQLRQKCCLSLRLICPEYAAIIEGQSQRLVNEAISIDGVAVFERSGKGAGEKRGRRNEPVNAQKNALIADTLARISNLLSVLLRGDNE